MQSFGLISACIGACIVGYSRTFVTNKSFIE